MLVDFNTLQKVGFELRLDRHKVTLGRTLHEKKKNDSVMDAKFIYNQADL